MKKKFIVIILNINNKTFIIYIATEKYKKIAIYYVIIIEIKFKILLFDKASIIIFLKY